MMRHDVCSAVSWTSSVHIERLVCHRLALRPGYAAPHAALRTSDKRRPSGADRKWGREGDTPRFGDDLALRVILLFMFPLACAFVCCRVPSRSSVLCAIRLGTARGKAAAGEEAGCSVWQPGRSRQTRQHKTRWYATLAGIAQLRSGAQPPERAATVCAIWGAADGALFHIVC
jgi:hypothetical protein